MYTIGETAKIVGLSTYTLRYYEQEKIITPSRKASGERYLTRNISISCAS
ncbi:MerR family transcriptional regulator [Listeria booriae]|nr:MerR family transcriptional regulator [Listeria booriae]